jgi:uncharacterized membrane protein
MNSVTAIDRTVAETRSAIAASSSEFWYSPYAALAFSVCLLILAQTTSLLIPPFQSPDEPAHIERAYLLSKGEIFLGSENGTTGGYIDTGLLYYIQSFRELPGQPEHKVSSSTIRASEKIEWTGRRQFDNLYNTAFYFSLAYLPQAVAFAIGEHTHLTVRDTYYFARAASLIATLGLVLAALLFYPMPIVVLAILVMPMTLFQLGSASLDSVTYGLTTLAAALFMRAASTAFSFRPTMHIALIGCLLLLATTRIPLFALTPLPAVLYIARRSRAYLISSAALICLSAGWIIYALSAVKGLPPRDLTTTELITHYLFSPYSFLRIITNTITSEDILAGYWQMFIGVLGWLDTPLGTETYISFAILFFVLGVISIEPKPSAILRWANMSLTGAAVCAVLAMYFIFLVTYSPYPAKEIDTIQGRYFIPTAIAVSYAVFGRRLSVPRRIIGLVVLMLMVVCTIVGTMPRLLLRYWAAS